MFKKDVVTKKLHDGSKTKPQVIKHSGKGSSQAPLRQHNNMDGAVGGDYGKQNTVPTTDQAPPSLGNGDWPGVMG